MSEYSVDPKWKRIMAMVVKSANPDGVPPPKYQIGQKFLIPGDFWDDSGGVQIPGPDKVFLVRNIELRDDPVAQWAYEVVEFGSDNSRSRWVAEHAFSGFKSASLTAADSTDPEAMKAWVERNEIWKAMQFLVRKKQDNRPEFWQLQDMYNEKSPMADRIGPPVEAGLVTAVDWKGLGLGLGLALSPDVAVPQESPEIEQKQHPVGWQHYEKDVADAAAKYSVPADMFMRLLKTENDIGNPNAVHPSSGATGLGQFMPETAEGFGIDPRDPAQAIDASAKYLSQLYRQFGNWEDAISAYNWGPGNVRRWIADGADPESMPDETVRYIKKISPPTESSQKS